MKLTPLEKEILLEASELVEIQRHRHSCNAIKYAAWQIIGFEKGSKMGRELAKKYEDFYNQPKYYPDCLVWRDVDGSVFSAIP